MIAKNAVKAVKILIYAVFGLCIAVFANAVFNFGNLEGLKINQFLYLLGRLSGLIGFLFLSALIISGDTARFFDRFFGMDKIIKFQREFAVITAVFVFAHPVFFMLSNGAFLAYIIPNFSILPLAFGIMAFYIFVIVSVASKIYKIISYRAWQYLHVLIYLLFFFSLYHAFFWGSGSNSLILKIIYAIALSLIIIGIIYRTCYKLARKHAKIFFVKDVKWETKDAFTLALRSENHFLFKPGLFCFLRLDKEKLYARHPFTIASAPGEGELRIIVRIKGRFTKALSELKPGERVIIDGPFGIFTVEDESKDLVFCAGGVGIAPFMSIIEDRIKNDKTQNVILFYGSRAKEDIIYENRLKDYATASWLKVVHVLSDNNFDSYEKGHINEEMVKKYAPNFKKSLFYICGPAAMKNKLKTALKNIGVKKENIFIEDFFW